MEYQNMINLLHNMLNQPSKFRTKIRIEINARETYDTNNQVKFKTTILKTSLCDYSNTYVLFEGIITVANTSTAVSATSNTNKKVIFKNFTHLLIA